MPLLPTGLTTGLIERIKQRVKRELGWGDDHGAETSHDQGRDPALEGPATDTASKRYRIQAAARGRMLLWLKYNNEWRHVEPYSYRQFALGPVLYGWCHLHDVIEAYYIDQVTNPETGKVHTGIQDVHVTDRPFSPRFDIEIG